MHGRERKASKNGETVGYFYNYKCNLGANGESKASNSDESVIVRISAFAAAESRLKLLNYDPLLLIVKGP